MKEDKILKYLESHPKVSFVHKPISHWDVEFGVFVKNPGQLREFMQELRNKFPDNIRMKNISLFYEEITGNHLPEGVFSAQ